MDPDPFPRSRPLSSLPAVEQLPLEEQQRLLDGLHQHQQYRIVTLNAIETVSLSNYPRASPAEKPRFILHFHPDGVSLSSLNGQLICRHVKLETNAAGDILVLKGIWNTTAAFQIRLQRHTQDHHTIICRGSYFLVDEKHGELAVYHDLHNASPSSLRIDVHIKTREMDVANRSNQAVRDKVTWDTSKPLVISHDSLGSVDIAPHVRPFIMAKRHLRPELYVSTKGNAIFYEIRVTGHSGCVDLGDTDDAEPRMSPSPSLRRRANPSHTLHSQPP